MSSMCRLSVRVYHITDEKALRKQVRGFDHSRHVLFTEQRRQRARACTGRSSGEKKKKCIPGRVKYQVPYNLRKFFVQICPGTRQALVSEIKPKARSQRKNSNNRRHAKTALSSVSSCSKYVATRTLHTNGAPHVVPPDDQRASSSRTA